MAVPGIKHRRGLSAGLTGTLFGFLIGGSGLAALGSALYFATFGLWSDWNDLGSTTLDDLITMWDTASVTVSFFYLTYVVTGILMIIWFNQAYKAAESRGATGNRWSSGWAVGGWFIPFANLVIPKLVVNEVDRMADTDLQEPIGETWTASRRSTASDWWWILYVVGLIVAQATWGLADEFGSGWLLATSIGFGILAVSGVFGAIFVRSLGRRLRAQS